MEEKGRQERAKSGRSRELSSLAGVIGAEPPNVAQPYAARGREKKRAMSARNARTSWRGRMVLSKSGRCRELSSLAGVIGGGAP